MLLGIAVAACAPAPSATPVITRAPLPTPAPSPTPGPTPAPTPAPTAVPFAGQPYSLDLPVGWSAFDLDDPSGQAALDTFVAANPDTAAAVEAFKALPDVTMAVNPTLGNVVVAYPFDTAGQTFEQLTASFTAQFAAVPGVSEPPVAEPLTLPAGPATHWNLTIQANDPGGGTYQVGESLYLATNGGTVGVLVVFVEVAGASVPQEESIIQSLQFAQ